MKNKDADYLAALRDFYARKGVLPSFSGIAALVGLKTTSAVSVMVTRLKEGGFLSSTDSKRLQPGPRFFERTKADVSILAGQPKEAVQLGEDSLLIDRHLIDEPSRTLLVPVDGYSMLKAGLVHGDTAIVKRGAPAEVGDIVLAIADGGYTIKYLARNRSGFYLKPASDEHPDIHPKKSLEIFGKVTGSFRKYP